MLDCQAYEPRGHHLLCRQSPGVLAHGAGFDAMTLRTLDPLPQIMQMLMALQGLHEHRERLYTILAELFANALEHGLLSLDSGLKHTPRFSLPTPREQSLVALDHGWIKILLTHTAMGTVGQLTLRIEDSGPGFDYQRCRPDLTANTTHSGSGIPWSCPLQSTDLPRGRELCGGGVCVVRWRGKRLTANLSACHHVGRASRHAADSSEALRELSAAAAAGADYDLAILDLQRPTMDGLQLARTMQANPTLASVRLVLVTPWATWRRRSRTRCRHSGLPDQTGATGPVTRLPACRTGLKRWDRQLITRHMLLEAKAQRRGRILLAEDNTVNQRVALGLLKRLGCRADVVSNGREAVEA